MIVVTISIVAVWVDREAGGVIRQSPLIWANEMRDSPNNYTGWTQLGALEAGKVGGGGTEDGGQFDTLIDMCICIGQTGEHGSVRVNTDGFLGETRFTRRDLEHESAKEAKGAKKGEGGWPQIVQMNIDFLRRKERFTRRTRRVHKGTQRILSANYANEREFDKGKRAKG
jgi:hypothetical protein